MELNLRKARKLESKIDQYLQEKDLDTSSSVRSLASLEEAKANLETKKSEFLKNLVDRENLLKTKYTIRKKIESKNEESGINSLINLQVLTKKLIEDLEKLPKESLSSDQELSDLLKAHSLMFQNGSNEKNNPFSRSPSIKTSFDVNCLSVNDLENLKTRKIKYKKNIEEIEEKLNLLNISQKIEIPEDMEKLLEAHKLL